MKRKRGERNKSGKSYSAPEFFEDTLKAGPDNYYSIDLTNPQKGCQLFKEAIYRKLEKITSPEEQADLKKLFDYFFGPYAYTETGQVVVPVEKKEIQELIRSRSDFLPTFAELLLMFWSISGKTYPGKDLIPTEFKDLKFKTLKIPASITNKIIDFQIVFEGPTSEKIFKSSVKNDRNAHGQSSLSMFLTDFKTQIIQDLLRLPENNPLRVLSKYLDDNSSLRQEWKNMKLGRPNKNVFPYWVQSLKEIGLDQRYSDRDLLIHLYMFKQVFFNRRHKTNPEALKKKLTQLDPKYYISDFDIGGRITIEYQQAFLSYFNKDEKNKKLQLQIKRTRPKEFYQDFGVNPEDILKDLKLPCCWPSLCIKLVASLIENNPEAKQIITNLLFGIHYYEYTLNFKPELDLRTARAGDDVRNIKIVAKGTSGTNSKMSWDLGGLGITVKVLTS